MLTTDRPDLFEDFSEIGWLLPTGKLLPGEQAIREFHSKSLTLSALTPVQTGFIGNTSDRAHR